MLFPCTCAMFRVGGFHFPAVALATCTVLVLLWLTLICIDWARFRIILRIFADLSRAKLTQAYGAALPGRRQHPVGSRRISRGIRPPSLEIGMSSPSHATLANESKAKSVFRVVSGNFLEMYDFMVYGYYAGQLHEKLFTHDGLRMGVVNCCEEALTLGFAKS